MHQRFGSLLAGLLDDGKSEIVAKHQLPLLTPSPVPSTALSMSSVSPGLRYVYWFKASDPELQQAYERILLCFHPSLVFSIDGIAAYDSLSGLIGPCPTCQCCSTELSQKRRGWANQNRLDALNFHAESGAMLYRELQAKYGQGSGNNGSPNRSNGSPAVSPQRTSPRKHPKTPQRADMGSWITRKLDKSSLPSSPGISGNKPN